MSSSGASCFSASSPPPSSISGSLRIDDRRFSMDSSPMHSTLTIKDNDEWDTEGFVIPSLGIEPPAPDESADSLRIEEQKPIVKDKEEEKIYLGPHGAPPQSKHQELNPPNRKQRFKQKLKDADKKTGGIGRENKVESLKELVGGNHTNAPKGCPREWLDPHCDESTFERPRSH